MPVKLIAALLLSSLTLISCAEPVVEKQQPAAKKEKKEKPKTNAAKPKNGKPTASGAAAQLNKLNVAAEVTSGYDRDLFNHWTTQPSGCDTRDTVLARQDQTGQLCGADTGSWFSLYDGEQFTDPGDLDVDHMVPLSEAWDSGAGQWSSAKREAYANDLYPYSLIAVSASSNRSKSDQDPSEWLPTYTPFLCQYTARWIDVKSRWALTIDQAEQNALRALIADCSSKELRLDNSWNKRAGSGEIVAPAAKKKPGQDPLFSSCSAAAAAGYGPYRRGQDQEYKNYSDGDQDGTVCE